MKPSASAKASAADAGIVSTREPAGDVLADGAREQDRVLVDDPDARAQPARIIVAKVASGDDDVAGKAALQPEQDSDQR
jgi:hypothetical protein